MKKLTVTLLSMLLPVCLMAQMGTRFPSERKVIKDPLTGVELVFLTSKSGTGDSKIYQTHNQWTADGKWVVFRSDRVQGEALAVNEETGVMVQITEGGFTGMLCVARKSMNLYHMRVCKDKNDKRIGMEVVEVNLERLFADSEAGKLKGKKNYERICGVIPAEMCSEGDMALDGSEEFVYSSGTLRGHRTAIGWQAMTLRGNYGSSTGTPESAFSSLPATRPPHATMCIRHSSPTAPK